MTEKSGKKVSRKTKTLNDELAPQQVVVRKRGRPPGAKNKPKLPVIREEPPHALTTTVKRRGRPKGSKNKIKACSPPQMVEIVVKKRGRPKGSKNILKTPVAVSVPLPAISTSCEKRLDTAKEQPASKIPSADDLTNHPLVLAASWLEKNMHPSEMQYYRSRAYKHGTSLQSAMMSDILGFFNVKESEITKQIKKNKTIVTVNSIPTYAHSEQN
jgi:hypothetical protein